MKTRKTKLVLLTLVSIFSLPPSTLLAQGSLTPPGAPAPTMKSLNQIEPCMPISLLPFKITDGGSYYLAVSVWHGTGREIVPLQELKCVYCGIGGSVPAPDAIARRQGDEVFLVAFQLGEA